MEKFRIILVGPGASGKDYLRKIMQNKGISYNVSYTSRPKRETEVDGVDYKFIEKNEFETLIEDNFFYEYTFFNNEYYGTSKRDWETKQLFIMNPIGILKINPADRKNCFIIYLNPGEHIIKERLQKRNDSNDSIERRLLSDKIDFENFIDYDLEITNSEF